MNKRVLYLDLTTQCNLRCRHCYNSRYFTEKADMFSYEVFCSQISNYEFRRWHLLGGEPLMSSHLFEVLDYALKKDILVSINTNGVYLDERMIDKLRAYPNLDQVTVSLDGGNEADNDAIRGKGTFSKVVSNLQKFKTRAPNIKLNLACVMTPSNLANIEFLPGLIDDYDCLLISMLFDQGNAENNFRRTDMDGNLLFEKIKRLVQNANAAGKVVQLDLPPIGLWWLQLLSGENLSEVDFPKSDCTESKLFYSATNKLYLCNPSSFLGEKYEIKDAVFPQVRQKRCAKPCIFNDRCMLCEINCDMEQFRICDYVLHTADQVFSGLTQRMIQKSNNYAFFSYQGHSYFANHSTGARFRICSGQNVNMYSPLEAYRQCPEGEKLYFRLIMSGLYTSGQFQLCETSPSQP